MSTYNAIEPTVIDEDLLKKAINEQVLSEIADVARKEGLDPIDVRSLRLDYKNILKIDNLWMFENLTKLQLDNNIIEKIENLGFLKNLRWLDLSFNNISRIEGLNGLTKLTDLTLHNNRITKIENLDDLVNLNVLSIGNNGLTVLENVIYLARFENLRVLNLSGNQICKQQIYRNYVLAHIRGLRYLDYRLVDAESVTAARQQYVDDIIAQEEEDKIVAAKKSEDKRQAELDALYESAHIQNIDTLFSSLFEDPDFRLFATLISPDPFTDLHDEFQTKCEVVINELKNFVLRRVKERQEEEGMFMDCLKSAREKVDGECMERLKAFGGVKKRLLQGIHHTTHQGEVNDLIKRLKDEVTVLSDELVSREMTLVEQFEDILKEFERNYTEISSTITEMGATSFARLRELENEFHERLTEAVVAAVERFIKGDTGEKEGREGGLTEAEMDDALRDLINDKDALVNAINSTHDFRLGKFDHQEDILVSGVAKNQELVFQREHEREIARNRERICEIVGFLERCQSEIEGVEEGA
ncbi:hypothetical protein BC832DRAFT_560967 [Gaertneriomyces semiglobifer]|nr:hypothetical protein BC832DRAFT_560967 [Gaertneriomyces semiglobifer]